MDNINPAINQAVNVSPGNRLRKLLPYIAVAVVVLVGAIVGGVAILRNPASPNNGNGQDVSLTYWGFSVEPSVMTPLIEQFEAENPGITVTYEKKAVDDYHSILKARLQGGDASVTPDVFELNNEYLNPFIPYLSVDSGSVGVTAQELNQDYHPAGAKVCAQSGFVWCYPENFDGLVMIYNETMLLQNGVEAIPDDWSDFKTWADGLTVKRTVEVDGQEVVAIDRSGAALGTASNVSKSDMLLWLLMIQNEVPINLPGRISELANSNAVAAAELYVSFYNDRIWDKRFESDIDAFLSSKVAVMFGTKEDVDTVIASDPSFQIRTVPVPQISGQVNLAHFQVIGVSNIADSSEAAWEWAQFLASSEAQSTLMQEAGRLPARRDLQLEISSADGMDGFEAIFLTSEPVFFMDYDVASANTIAAIGAMTLDESPEDAATALEELVEGLTMQ